MDFVSNGRGPRVFFGEWGLGVAAERWIASWRMGGMMKESESLIG